MFNNCLWSLNVWNRVIYMHRYNVSPNMRHIIQFIDIINLFHLVVVSPSLLYYHYSIKSMFIDVDVIEFKGASTARFSNVKEYKFFSGLESIYFGYVPAILRFQTIRAIIRKLVLFIVFPNRIQPNN